MTLRPHEENGAWMSGRKCPDAEALAGYTDGRLTAADRAEIETHLASCEDCYLVFSETVQEQQSERATIVQPRYRWAVGAAAGLAVAAGIFLAVGTLRTASYSRPPAPTLVAALNELDAAAGVYRKFEPRLTVTFTHREMEPRLRSVDTTGAPSSAQPGATDNALREAVRKVQTAAKVNGTGSEERRALAAMYFTLGQAEPAAAVLEPEATSTDAGLLSDLAAVYLARRADGDVERAVNLLEHAVALDPKRAEAWFNLGLAAGAARQPSRSEEAWK